MSDRALHRTLVALGVIGFALATYLTIVHYGKFVVLCTTKHNSCQAVQHSIYSTVFGIPVALLGLIGYILILASLFAPQSELTRLATLGVTLFGMLFSGYLTYREVFTLKEICEWCVSSAILMLLLFIGAAIRYLRGAPLGLPPDPSPAASS
jgi:uncharacterized membrane protein